MWGPRCGRLLHFCKHQVAPSTAPAPGGEKSVPAKRARDFFRAAKSVTAFPLSSLRPKVLPALLLLTEQSGSRKRTPPRFVLWPWLLRAGARCPSPLSLPTRRIRRIGKESGRGNRAPARRSQGQRTNRGGVRFREPDCSVGQGSAGKTSGRSEESGKAVTDFAARKKSRARFGGTDFSPPGAGAVEGATWCLQKCKRRPHLGPHIQGANGGHPEIRHPAARIPGPGAGDAPRGGRACYSIGGRIGRDLPRGATCARGK